MSETPKELRKNIWVEKEDERKKKKKCIRNIFILNLFSIAICAVLKFIYTKTHTHTTHIFKFNKKYQRVHFNWIKIYEMTHNLMKNSSRIKKLRWGGRWQVVGG